MADTPTNRTWPFKTLLTTPEWDLVGRIKKDYARRERIVLTDSELIRMGLRTVAANRGLADQKAPGSTE